MTKTHLTFLAAILLCVVILCSMVMPGGTESGATAAPSAAGKRGRSPRRPLRVGHPTFASPHASPIAVRGDLLYVIPFKSNNKTQLSGGAKDDIDGDLVTFDAWEHSIRVNNVLSLGHVTDTIKHPDVPDRDLFFFDTKTDELVETVDTLGTLLCGLTVDSQGRVFIAQTDAPNDVNGRAGTKKHGVKEIENRAFLNQITRVRFLEPNALESGATSEIDATEKAAASAVGSQAHNPRT